ncbi:PAS/PAC sensor hybrid histidine kinase [Desulforamulus reducens MI-1]|uniref:Stage 0 sporulation protein A homolog n=1 Tax=Desulforamulus reducens (strain ATCC BAA-1160 / DSM 100696 / MI-1) TaxID=349161 RepID=A4J400_DESRM|nr:PAS domain S-box protein [Desulforamulus reducens]ABO49803.1 PAS/PAC sensor hybrid histidine kinase [Desulforamulus reducens MI-1]
MENAIKILMVDDQYENLLALEGILESPMYRLVTATSGEEALKQVLKDDFAVILLDVRMPGLNGYETAKIIRSRGKSRHTPIIFITANHQDTEQVHKGYALGAIDYIFKPVDPETLRYKISGFVNLYKHQEQLEIMVQQRTQELLLANERLQREVKQHKQTEEELRKSEGRFRIFFEKSQIGIILLSPEGGLLESNPAFQKMIGYTDEELKRMVFTEFTHPEYIEKNIELYQKLLEGEIEYYEIKKRYLSKCGKLIWGHLTVFSTRDINAKIEFVIAFVQDITEKKILEEEMVRFDRLNMVGEMAAGISHEVRNPMTTVRGFLQMLQGKDDCSRYKDYFTLMIQELDRANSIITEFLSIGRNTPSNLEKQNINFIVNSLKPLLQADAFGQGKYVQVETNKVPDLLLDSKEIRQIILNLCRNGLEAMTSGGRLIIRTYLENRKVVLTVQDEGEGIRSEVMEKLGTPFFTTKANGTGLGLSICYSIAARHNAVISIDTSANGTTFYVKFNCN